MKIASRWTIAWLALVVALALHVAEEVVAVRQDQAETWEVLRLVLPWLPSPVFHPVTWLVNVAGALAVLVALSSLVERQSNIMRPASYALAAFAAGNGALHIALSLAAGAVLAGALTAPLLLIASLYLLVSIPRVLPRATS